MDTERARTFLLALPHVAETQQWGDNLVFWVGDKTIGGKMFCLLDLDRSAHGVCSFAAGPERFHELLEREGLVPAPYMARIFWVAAQSWNALRHSEWEESFGSAYKLTLAKLPKRTRDVLALPAQEQQQLIAERRKQLALKGEAKKAKAKRRSK